MIHLYNDANLSKWNSGEFKVQLLLPNRTRPMGYCDGTDDDERELLSMAEEEGESELEVAKKYLWTGREIWTITSPGNTEVQEDEFE